MTLLFALLVSCATAVPNFLIIVADDLGYADIGVYGSVSIKTPNLDRMAAEGLKFTNHISAASICTPSRGSLWTGRLPIRSGLYTWLDYPWDLGFRVFYPSSVGCLPSTELTLAEIMKAQNPKLTTSFIGKWHLGHNQGCLPPERGFDFFYGLPYSHEEGYPGPAPEDLIWPPMPLMNGMTIVQQPVNLTDLTQRYTSKALGLLDQYSKANQSFLMHVAYEEPHVPLFANPQFLNTSRRGLYGDAVEQMDDSIGQILQKLRDTGLYKNTIVYFTSDNGAWINPSSGIPGAPPAPLTGGSNGPLQDGKGSTWEGGMREPAIFWWPNMIKPGLSQELISMMDVFPTFLALANMTSPATANYTIDGLNIAPLLLGTNKTSPHNYIYYWREHTVYAVRNGPWKCHYYTRSGFDTDPPVQHDPPLLFNVDWDPAEKVPLNVSDYSDIVNDINNALQQHIQEVVPGISQYEKQDWKLVPCCHSTFNSTDFLEFVREHEWSLALWEELGCVCLDEIDTMSSRFL